MALPPWTGTPTPLEKSGGVRAFVVMFDPMAGFVGLPGLIPAGVPVIQGAQGVQGPKGDKGDPGDTAASYSAIANGTISQYKVVAMVGGKAVVADPANAAHRGLVGGVAMVTATDGQSLDVQFGGTITNPGWNWIGTGPVYLTVGGTLSQTAPTTGFEQAIAIPVNPTTLLIELGPSIGLTA